MNELKNAELLLSSATAGGFVIRRARIVELCQTGEILVSLTDPAGQRVLCDFLQVAEKSALQLVAGDGVLVLAPPNADQKGCVIGRMGAYAPPQTDRVVLEADQELVLQCGEGSITIRKDGKLLTKAVDIVSRAKRTQRIKGGSVQIN